MFNNKCARHKEERSAVQITTTTLNIYFYLSSRISFFKNAYLSNGKKNVSFFGTFIFFQPNEQKKNPFCNILRKGSDRDILSQKKNKNTQVQEPNKEISILNTCILYTHAYLTYIPSYLSNQYTDTNLKTLLYTYKVVSKQNCYVLSSFFFLYSCRSSMYLIIFTCMYIFLNKFSKLMILFDTLRNNNLFN